MPDYLVTLYNGKEKIEEIITAKSGKDANDKAKRKYPKYVINEFITATIKLS